MPLSRTSYPHHRNPYIIGVAVIIAALVASQFKTLVYLTQEYSLIHEYEVAHSDQSQVKTQTKPSVTCDSTPCNGFFAYDGPNKNKTSAASNMQNAVAAYHYGGEKNSETENTMIFMPDKTDPRECIQEWKESRAKWVDR
jgi:hypothetical protein